MYIRTGNNIREYSTDGVQKLRRDELDKALVLLSDLFCQVPPAPGSTSEWSAAAAISKIAQSCNRSDVFTTEELKVAVISPYAEVIVDEGEIVQDWRTPITKKYSKLPGIRTLHDFVYVYNPVTSGVVAKVRKVLPFRIISEFK